MKKILFIIFSITVLASCERKIDELPASSNGVDFSNYVAVGNSLTAGFADNALYASGQANSITNILASQFKYVGGGEFRQPLIGTEEGVGVQLTPAGPYFFTKLNLQIVPNKDCQGQPDGTASLKPALINPNASQTTLMQQLFAPPAQTGPYNNMGVPGLTLMSMFYNRLADPTPDGHPFNPFFVRFASSPTTTVLNDALAQQPTFFSFWIGNNDILLSALAGSDLLMTPADTFAKYYPMAVGALATSAKKPKGILANIPYVTSIPFFTTISKQLPYNNVVLNQEQAAGLNQLYTMYGHPEIVWKTGNNPFVYINEDGTWKQMAEGDLFLLTLPTDSVKCRGMGIADPTALPIPKPYPIPGKYILTKAEQANIIARTDQFNAIIKNVATTFNLAHVDMNQTLKTLESGMVFDGIKMTTTFVTGGAFSTDGVHLNFRGNAAAANFFIDAINAKYGSSIPHANITGYPGLVFP